MSSFGNNNFSVPDLTYLREMSGGDESFIKEIIGLFIEDCPSMLKAIQESAAAGDHEKLRILTHKLVPQLTFVGILSVISDVKEINKESREMNSSDLAEKIARLTEIVNLSIEYYKEQGIVK